MSKYNPTEIEGFSMSYLMDISDSDLSFVLTLLEHSYNELSDFVVKCNMLILEEDAKEFVLLVHKIKPTAQMFKVKSKDIISKYGTVGTEVDYRVFQLFQKDVIPEIKDTIALIKNEMNLISKYTA